MKKEVGSKDTLVLVFVLIGVIGLVFIGNVISGRISPLPQKETTVTDTSLELNVAKLFDQVSVQKRMNDILTYGELVIVILIFSNLG